MATLLYRLGRFSARRRWLVLSTWAVVLVALAALGGGLTQHADSEEGFSIPGTDASRGLDLIGEKFSASSDAATGTVVFQAPSGRTLTGAEADAVEALLSDLRTVDGVAAVSDPLSAQTPRLSTDQTIAAATVTFTEGAGAVSDSTAEQFRDATDHDLAVSDGSVRVEVTSDLPDSESGAASEAVGILVAIVVLVVTYGSLVAAGANLLTSLSGVGVGILGITVLGKFVPLSSSTPVLASMLGLAVGIDYALFVLARVRTELRAGNSVVDSVAKATGTAGTAVVFAGTTVVIALVGLAVVNIPFLTEMGLGGAATIAVAVLIALTAVPALASLAGRRLLPRRERGRDSDELRTAAGAAREAEAADADSSDRQLSGSGLLGAWSRGTTRHPVIALVVAVVALGVVTIPVASMRTALPSAATADPATSARQAYDLLVQGFGEGSQSALIVLVDGEDAASVTTAATETTAKIQPLADVVAVSPGTPSADGTAQLITVVPGSGPTDQATTDLVNDIRSAVTTVEDTTGTEVLVTGQTALAIDVTDSLTDALPVYIALIVVLALFLLIMVFRSLAVPLLATLGFLLSLGAGLGATVAIFQWGWLADVFRVSQPAPLLSFMPVLVVGILFGLAMDYQLFMVSAIHEAHAHGRSPRHAVLAGFRQASPVVVAASLIMSGVFMGFATSGNAIISSIGTALTIGVLTDALVVRMVIMPAALTLLGNGAWWMPRWLQPLVPNVDAEGRRLEQHLAKA